MGAEADVTTRLRTNAEWEQQGGLMEAVCERGNLQLAYQRVVENKGSAGVDGIGVGAFKDHLKQHWPAIKAKLLAGGTCLRRGAGWTSRSRKVERAHSASQR